MSSLSNQSILSHTIPKHWLVVVYTPLKNMSSSVGIMKFPTEWKNIIHVPNHQADNEFWALLTGSTGFYISLTRDGEGWNHIRTGHGLPTKNHAISRIRKTQQTSEHRDGSFLGPWINGYLAGLKKNRRRGFSKSPTSERWLQDFHRLVISPNLGEKTYGMDKIGEVKSRF